MTYRSSLCTRDNILSGTLVGVADGNMVACFVGAALGVGLELGLLLIATA
jgi:hypothetical protein